MISNRYMPTNFNRRVIGSYEYHENQVAGRGTNSIVFKGKKISSDLPVCVKVITHRSSVTEKFAKAEIEVLKKVEHPHSLKYFAHFERGLSTYIVTEQCQTSLLSKIKSQGKISQQSALKLFLQVLEGYEQLRNKGFIHRDIKPENILVQDNILKLADFGYSTILRRNSIKQNFNVGTPLYMAPESLLQNIYSEKSDIWSLGVTLHELLHSFTPFISQSQEDLKKEIKRSIKISNSSDIMKKILTNCFLFDSERRYTLQKLMLEVKMTLLRFEQQERQRISDQTALKLDIVTQNELNYLSFLQYVKDLTVRASKIDRSLAARIEYFFEYQLRMRIKFNEKTFINQDSAVSQHLQDHFAVIKRQHDFVLQLPNNLNPNDRLLFFNPSEIKFCSSLQWQTQAELKHLIRILLTSLSGCSSEQEVMLNEGTIKLVDFLLAAFVLNRMLIQTENNREQFTKIANLTLLLSAPSRVTARVLGKIRKKAQELNLSP